MATQCKFQFASIGYLSGSLAFVGQSTAAGWNTAINQYASDTLYEQNDVTSNIESLNASCSIKMILHDTELNIDIAKNLTDNIISSSFINGPINDNHNTNIPIIVTGLASGHSLTIQPLIESFNITQISSISTSSVLTDYKYFYRTIPSDDFQAETLIALCSYFEFNQIGVLHVNTTYGISLTESLIFYANNPKYNINIQSFGYISDDVNTIENAVKLMKQSGLFVFILILYKYTDAATLATYNMVNYPYYYIGTDSLLYAQDFIFDKNLNVFGGMIGSCPWTPKFNNDPLIDLYQNIYPMNESYSMYISFYDEWQDEILNNPSTNYLYNHSEPDILSLYGYDNILSVIKAIDQYIETFNIDNINSFWNDMNGMDFKQNFKSILNDFWFIGLTGNVSFDLNGDRQNGLMAICNVKPDDGTINMVGFMIQGSDKIHIMEKNIVWPYDYHQTSEPTSTPTTVSPTSQPTATPALADNAIALKRDLVYYFLIIYILS